MQVEQVRKELDKKMSEAMNAEKIAEAALKKIKDQSSL